MWKIRPALLSDSAQIAEIYRPYVQNTAISFENNPPSSTEMASRMEENAQKFPWFVCENDKQILGYAYASAHRSRPAYGWTVESTVYLRQNFSGQRIGTSLYQALLATLKAQGVVNVLGGIALPNEASIALHVSLGFEKVAHFKDIGFKLGKWWDVGYYQLQLQKPAHPTSLSTPSFPRSET